MLATQTENRHRSSGPYPVPVPPAIATKDLLVAYGDAVALCDVTMEVPLASSLAVIGPNGSGKSTLLGVLAGTIEANSGLATVAGRPPALVQQSTDVDRSLPITVRDTVSLARYQTLGLFRRFQSADRDAIDGAMERLAVDDLAKAKEEMKANGARIIEAGTQVFIHPRDGHGVMYQLIERK